MALPKPCMHPGCPETTRERRCRTHRVAAGARLRERRGKVAERGYGATHRKWRARVLRKDPLCVECLLEGTVERATVADHIVPIRDGGARFSLENGQGLCAMHHNRKTARER